MPLLVWSEVMIFSIHGTNLFYLVSVNHSIHSMPTEDVGLLTDEVEYVSWLVPGKLCTQEGICETASFSWLQRQGPWLASHSGSGLHSRCPRVWWHALFSLQGGKSKVVRLETLFYPPYSIRYSKQIKRILEHIPYPGLWMDFRGFPKPFERCVKCNMDGTHPLLWVQTVTCVGTHPLLWTKSVTWMVHTIYCGCKVWHGWVHTLYCEKEAPEDFAEKIGTAVPWGMKAHTQAMTTAHFLPNSVSAVCPMCQAYYFLKMMVRH